MALLYICGYYLIDNGTTVLVDCMPSLPDLVRTMTGGGLQNPGGGGGGVEHAPAAGVNILKNDRQLLNRVDSGTGSDAGNLPTEPIEDAVTRSLNINDDDGYPQTDEYDDDAARDSAYEEESLDCWPPPGLARQSSCLEAVPEDSGGPDDESQCQGGGSCSRRASALEEDLLRDFSSRRTSHVGGGMSRRGSLFDEAFGLVEGGGPPGLLGRRDSLMEAVLAAKRT